MRAYNRGNLKQGKYSGKKRLLKHKNQLADSFDDKKVYNINC